MFSQRCPSAAETVTSRPLDVSLKKIGDTGHIDQVRYNDEQGQWRTPYTN